MDTCWILTLREAYDENEIDGDESKEIAHDHSVDHHDERADRLETPAEKQEVRRRRKHHHDRKHVLDFIGASQSQKRER